MSSVSRVCWKFDQTCVNPIIDVVRYTYGRVKCVLTSNVAMPSVVIPFINPKYVLYRNFKPRFCCGSTDSVEGNRRLLLLFTMCKVEPFVRVSGANLNKINENHALNITSLECLLEWKIYIFIYRLVGSTSEYCSQIWCEY